MTLVTTVREQKHFYKTVFKTKRKTTTLDYTGSIKTYILIDIPAVSTICAITLWTRSAASWKLIFKDVCRHCKSSFKCSQKKTGSFDVCTGGLTIFDTSSSRLYKTNDNFTIV